YLQGSSSSICKM
ncbi:hypothetical protein JL09_g6989, partial [Pichia kudriavzevii]